MSDYIEVPFSFASATRKAPLHEICDKHSIKYSKSDSIDTLIEKMKAKGCTDLHAPRDQAKASKKAAKADDVSELELFQQFKEFKAMEAAASGRKAPSQTTSVSRPANSVARKAADDLAEVFSKKATTEIPMETCGSNGGRTSKGAPCGRKARIEGFRCCDHK